MVIDTGQNFCGVPSAPQYMTMRLRSQTYNIYVEVFTVSVLAKPLVDLIHVWPGDRNLSKSLSGAIPTPWYDL